MRTVTALEVKGQYLPHNTYQIYVKPHLKNTQMTLEYQIFDEKALEYFKARLFSGFSVAKTFSWRRAWRQPLNCPRFV